MRDSDGKLCFSEKKRGKVWKDYMEGIMIEENDWDHNVEGDAVEGQVVCVSIEEMLQALKGLEWALSIVVSIFKGRVTS